MATLTTSFTTFASVTRSGSNGLGWSSPSNAQTSNDVRSGLTATPSGSGYTNHIKATGLADALPAGAIIQGIKVTVQRRDASGTTYDSEVRLVIGGAVSGTNKADTTTQWPSTDGDTNYGGAADLWGLTPTVTQLNASDFGFVLSATVGSGGSAGGGD